MGKAVARHATAADRAAQAEYIYTQRLTGRSYAEIAEELGCSRETVRVRIDQALAERVDPLVEQYRQVESDRLDAWLTKLQPRIAEGDVTAVSAAVRISERRARLWGLDAPQTSRVELDSKLSAAGDLVAECLHEALGAVLGVSGLETWWADQLKRYGLDVARWVLEGRNGPPPVAPPPPPQPRIGQPALPRVVEPRAIMPGPGSDPVDGMLRWLDDLLGPDEEDNDGE